MVDPSGPDAAAAPAAASGPGIAALLRRRSSTPAFRPAAIERRRLTAVLEAGRILPSGPSRGCRAVALEAAELRQPLIRALCAAGIDAAVTSLLDTAPVLVAMCDERGDGGGRPGAWMAAAQMALAAEEEGLAVALCAVPASCAAPGSLSLPAGGRVEAVLALGRPALAAGLSDPIAPPPGAEVYMGVAPPPAGVAGGGREVLPSFMEIVSAAAGAEDLEGLIETIARALGRLFPVDGASLGLLEEDGVVVREILRRGGAVRREPRRLPADASHLMGWVIVRGRPLWRNDSAHELRFAESLPRAGMRSDMTIPLRARGRVTGAFRVACRRRHAFEAEDFEVLQRCADLTALAVENQRLLLRTRRLSEIDGLTGISNHRHFVALLEQEVARAGRTGQPVSLIMIDIDDFKRLNDTHGHPAGDAVLRHVARTVAGLLRRSDAVARYGGEEFAALLGEAGLDAALGVAETIRSELERTPLRIPSLREPVGVTISLGVATLPADAVTGSALVEAADRGLYEAKRAGKNCVRHAG